jgi:hypothetical protein
MAVDLNFDLRRGFSTGILILFAGIVEYLMLLRVGPSAAKMPRDLSRH